MRANGEVICGKEGTSHLSLLDQNPVGKGEKERKRRKEKK